MGRLDDAQRRDIRALLDRGFSSAEVARRLGVPTMRVAAVRAHMTMGSYDQALAPGRGEGSAAPGAQADIGARDRNIAGHVLDTAEVAAGLVASVGIDVAESKRGLDLVGLDRERNILVSRGGLSVADVVAHTISLRPAVVCIDSPSGWSSSGRSRQSERLLAQVGIQSYRTGPDPGDHPFYAWMKVGFEIFAGLAAFYPLYRGGEVAGTAAEIFPHATACLLAGELRPTETPKEVFRRSVLREAGVAEQELATLDRVDAALGALTGLIALDHDHSVVGNPDEGLILLPVPDRPQGRLPQRDRAIAAVPVPSRNPAERVDPQASTRADDHPLTHPALASQKRVSEPTAQTERRSRGSLDFQRAISFIAAVPRGRWTSYKDVATTAGNERGAQAIGEWLRRRGHEVPHVHRVIRSSGYVADGFRAGGPGVPSNALAARDLLETEGVRFDVRGRANPDQRFRPNDWGRDDRQ